LVPLIPDLYLYAAVGLAVVAALAGGLAWRKRRRRGRLEGKI
jgi:LPXTG-motif cell wall-anchored protein